MKSITESGGKHEKTFFQLQWRKIQGGRFNVLSVLHFDFRSQGKALLSQFCLRVCNSNAVAISTELRTVIPQLTMQQITPNLNKFDRQDRSLHFLSLQWRIHQKSYLHTFDRQNHLHQVHFLKQSFALKKAFALQKNFPTP